MEPGLWYGYKIRNKGYVIRFVFSPIFQFLLVTLRAIVWSPTSSLPFRHRIWGERGAPPWLTRPVLDDSVATAAAAT